MSFEPRSGAGFPAAPALFLDVDGTLLDIAETPDAVQVTPRILRILRALRLYTEGALALVSGRSLANLDLLFEPLLLPAAGLHGFERRSALGAHHRRPIPNGAILQRAREALHGLAARHDGLLVEDKRFALALHFRQAPHLARTVVEAMSEIAAAAQPELVLQLGRMVAELRPAAAGKGAAVDAFLAEAPFIGRYPVYIGDDLTDESAFERVNNAGGLSIAVNVRRPTAALASLPSVAAVHEWLCQVLRRGAESLGSPSNSDKIVTRPAAPLSF